MKTEIGDRGRLNHITVISLSTTNPQWVQNDCMVISWIINNNDHDLVEYFVDYTTSTRTLWTRIHFILGPVPLPPVDKTIQREVVRGRSIVEKTSSGFDPLENQKPEKTNQNQDLKENSKILNKGTGNLQGVTDSTTTTIHAELKVENNEKKGHNYSN